MIQIIYVKKYVTFILLMLGTLPIPNSVITPSLSEQVGVTFLKFNFRGPSFQSLRGIVARRPNF
jgi:hypothetical protein